MAFRPYFQFIPTFFEGNNCCCILTMTGPTIIGEFLQQQESPFFPRKFLSFPLFFGLVWFFLFVARGLLGLLFPRGFGCRFLFFFGMVFSLCPLSVRNTPCPHCFSLYTLSGLLRHVKSAHTPTSLIS